MVMFAVDAAVTALSDEPSETWNSMTRVVASGLSPLVFSYVTDCRNALYWATVAAPDNVKTPVVPFQLAVMPFALVAARTSSLETKVPLEIVTVPPVSVGLSTSPTVIEASITFAAPPSL